MASVWSATEGVNSRVGIIGAGSISDQYAATLREVRGVELAFVAGRDPVRAEARARQLGAAAGGSISRLLSDVRVDAVLNLTPPSAHFELTMMALAAGKHVWSEKPAALTLEEFDELAAAAQASELRVGVAPDTFLGPGVQEAVRMLQSGAIGIPRTGLAIMQKPGPEAWHPSPEFLYRRGAGPVHDIGVYYLTALTELLGSVVKVTAEAQTAPEKRTIASGSRAGLQFSSEVPTTVSAVYEFERGAQVSAHFSFDGHRHREVLELTGDGGEISIPDPDRFGGVIELRRAGDVVESKAAPAGSAGRGIGLVEMLNAAGAGRPHRASLERARHVHEALELTLASAATGVTTLVASRLPADDGTSGFDSLAV